MDFSKDPRREYSGLRRLVEDTRRTAGQNSHRNGVTVTLSDAENVLQIRLRTTGLDAIAGEHIVARARDRIVALNGSVTLATAGDQMTIEAAIPCAS